MYDSFFPEDVSDRVTALTISNNRAMSWAVEFGANKRDVDIARAAYQAALLDMAVAFGLHRSVLRRVMDRCSR